MKKISQGLIALALLMTVISCSEDTGSIPGSISTQDSTGHNAPSVVRPAGSAQRVAGNTHTGEDLYTGEQVQITGDPGTSYSSSGAEWTVADATFPTPIGRTTKARTYGKFYTDAVAEINQSNGQLRFTVFTLAPELGQLIKVGQLTYADMREACIATGGYVTYRQRNLATYTREQKKLFYFTGGNLYACIKGIDWLLANGTLNSSQRATLKNLKAGFQATFENKMFVAPNLRSGSFVSKDEITRKVDLVFASPDMIFWYDYPGSANL